MARAFVLVLDSVGIGGAPDAARYGDAGADTIGHIAEACARGAADRDGVRAGSLMLPNLVRLGLGEACRLATGRVPPGLAADAPPIGGFGCATETSRGKDTPSGHWEIAGCPVTFDWGYFPNTVQSFPPDLIAALCGEAHIPGILGDRHASGTEIIATLGEEHIRSGKPICYTSADSVFQIAAHEEAFGLARLYEVCRVARRLVDTLTIGRVIARPFTGTSASDFVRTGNRKDFAVPPPGPTILDAAAAADRDVITIGKIGDIFAHRGTGREWPATGNAALFDRTLDGADALADGGLLFANFIDFDSLYGHRRDVAGYAAALEAFDRRLPALLARLRTDDLVVITADHGCDPTWPGTDHTREQVPVLTYGPAPAPLGALPTYAAIAALVIKHIDVCPLTDPHA
ncbi:phosphopentomutase [Rhodoplanes elegans]|uniref:Phosphopentomutase n=1 Tax=Rhodoplanes elegans TaxID=29408 RepID=A0A327KTE2_9BRAD|nr:phosphopentomutase [Rhodoplanes elegans]MBK5957707.1 phosphopentomutase [Rhodoplanes elegans]RAI41547.1 phosphopentomutase [Rhodoplanes elegans]